MLKRPFLISYFPPFWREGSVRSKDNPRKFWSIISGAKNRQITEMEPNSVVVVPEKCCVILNNAFACFFNQCFLLFSTTTKCQYTTDESNYYSWVGVRKLIDNLTVSSTTGPDVIISKMLKCTGLFTPKILALIFEQSLLSRTLPGDWKMGKVVTAHKSGNIHSLDNYCPISLT